MQSFSGLIFDIFSLIQHQLQFNYTMVLVTPNKSAHLSQTFDSNPVIAKIQRDEADFSIVDMTILHDRTEVFFKSLIIYLFQCGTP